MIVRSGQLDLAIVAGPRVSLWPSVGVLELSRLASQMGLKTGLFGGESVDVRGVIPQPGTGGLVLVEDVQKRIHRIEARAVVKVARPTGLPDPFPGWRSQGLIPLETARRLRAQGQVYWDPCVVILGTGNEALRFGSDLLETGAVPEAYCVETHAAWGAKRFAGWEVEKRRFEMNGGRVIEAKPLSLSPRGPLLWEFRLQDAQGVRVLEVGRVVSAGPFDDSAGVREYPAGSSLFELEQTAARERAWDVAGWDLEQERGKWLAGKIVKALSRDLGDRRLKDELDSRWKRARGRLRRFFRHREVPFTPTYQGKWLGAGDLKAVRTFGGVPKREHLQRLMASVECFETISCNVCATVCPEQAIEHTPAIVLDESRCTACGLCARACPSGSIPLIHERGEHQLSKLVLPWRGNRPWKVGASASVVNRRGEVLGSARVSALPETGPSGGPPLVQLDVPTHLVWEARGLRKVRAPATEDEAFMESVRRSASSEEKVEITIDGERRMVRDQVSVSVALFESGQGRPEDVLYCPDGSCGLCQVSVDGVKKLACRAVVHRGMAIRLGPAPAPGADAHLCPCLGVSVEEVVERIHQGKLRSPEAVLSVARVGEGKCHGQLCMEAFRRAIREADPALRESAEGWADWRFPWSDWTIG